MSRYVYDNRHVLPKKVANKTKELGEMESFTGIIIKSKPSGTRNFQTLAVICQN